LAVSGCWLAGFLICYFIQRYYWKKQGEWNKHKLDAFMASTLSPICLIALIFMAFFSWMEDDDKEPPFMEFM